MVMHLGIWIVPLACLCASIEAFKEETLVENFPGYAITTAIDQLNSTRCRREMEEYRDAVRRRVLWSMKMLDSSGQPSSGFIVGNNYWQGNKDECRHLSKKLVPQMSIHTTTKYPIYSKIPEPFPPFQLNFFGAHIRHNSSYQYHVELRKEDIIVLGLCLPASCSEHEVGTMLNKVFDDRLLSVAEFYSMDLQLIRISDLQIDFHLLRDGRIITSVVILLALIGVVVAATLYDCLVHQNRLKKRQELVTYQNSNTSELKNGGDTEEKQEHVQHDAVPSGLRSTDRIGRILMCFSAYSNIQRIFKVEDASKETALFHGMKVFGMFCIVTGHTLFYSFTILVNRADGYVISTRLDSQVFNAATLSVETFFFISGYLMTFTYLKAQTRGRKVTSFHRNASNFVGAIIKRYIRITPVYVVTILIAFVILSCLEKVSLWFMVDSTPDLCSKYWWRNILYINNFFHWDELCLNWSWYLSSDMQFYVFGVFLLILSSSYYYTSLAIGVAAVLVSVALPAYMTYATGFIPTLDTYYTTLTYMYLRPWMRIQPYVIGMGTALITVKLDGKLHLSKKVLAVGWFVSIFCIGSGLFGLANRHISLTLSILYQTFHKLAWSIAMGWITVASATDNAGVLKKILSLPYWVPFSRVTFCAYLLNPIVIMAIAMTGNYPWQVDNVFTFTFCVGVYLLTYMCAFGLSIIVEVPAIHFLRTLVAPNRRNK